MKKLTKKEIAKLRKERDFIEALYESIEHDIFRLRELEATYIVKATRCSHRHPNGKSAFKFNTETCENCNAKHRHCSICGLIQPSDNLGKLQFFPHSGPQQQVTNEELEDKLLPKSRFSPN